MEEGERKNSRRTGCPNANKRTESLQEDRLRENVKKMNGRGKVGGEWSLVFRFQEEAHREGRENGGRRKVHGKELIGIEREPSHTGKKKSWRPGYTHEPERANPMGVKLPGATSSRPREKRSCSPRFLKSPVNHKKRSQKNRRGEVHEQK